MSFLVPSSDLLSNSRQRVFETEDAARGAGEVLAELHARRALFVVDRDAFRFSGAEERFAPLRDRLEVAIFDDFQVNPKLEDVERGAKRFREFRPDAIVAIGGGSALDMAKLIGACGPQQASPRECVLGAASLETAPPPLIAVPTTAGTGSEATHFAVVYVDGAKRSLADERLRPAYAVLDPTLTYSLPKPATVATGLDAICQSIESTWSVGATESSACDAFASLELAWTNLPLAATRPDPENRLAMLRAAHLSGRAIDATKTTAPHACSYAFTTRHGTPHGLAVALTLGPFLRWNAAVADYDCADPRGAEHVRGRIAAIVERLGADSVEDACRRWEAFLQDLGAPISLREIGVDSVALSEFADDVNVERLSNNPRRIDRDALVDLLRSIH